MTINGLQVINRGVLPPRLVNGRYRVVCNQCGAAIERCCLCNVETCTNAQCVAYKCDCDREKER